MSFHLNVSPGHNFVRVSRSTRSVDLMPSITRAIGVPRAESIRVARSLFDWTTEWFLAESE